MGGCSQYWGVYLGYKIPQCSLHGLHSMMQICSFDLLWHCSFLFSWHPCNFCIIHFSCFCFCECLHCAPLIKVRKRNCPLVCTGFFFDLLLLLQSPKEILHCTLQGNICSPECSVAKCAAKHLVHRGLGDCCSSPDCLQ